MPRSSGASLRQTWTWFRVFAALLGLAFAYYYAKCLIDPPTTSALQNSSKKEDNPHSSGAKVDTSASREAEIQLELNNLESEVKAERMSLDVQRNETTHLTDYAKSMMTVVGIFTLLFGAASWKTLEDQRKAADDALSRQRAHFEEESKSSLTKLERFRDELQLDFPMLGRIQNNFQTVLVNLRTVGQSLELRDDTYSKLNWKEKQDILFYENAITTALLLNTKGYERELSEIYRLLGDFYGSRFFSEVKDDKFKSNPRTGDFDRARFYFDRAIDLDQDGYVVYMHAGHFTQYYDDLFVADISKKYFDRAAKIRTNFQKPLVSIALIELEAFSDPSAALELLEYARKRTSYDLDRNDPRTGYIAYLEACAFALKAKSDGPVESLESLKQALGRLEESMNLGPDQSWAELSSAFPYDRSKYFSGHKLLLGASGDLQEQILQRFDAVTQMTKKAD